MLFLALLVGCQNEYEMDPTAQNIRDGREAASAAFQGLNQGDLPTYLREIQRASLLRPNHPQIEFHKARAFILNGDTLNALTTLSNMAEMGIAMTLDDPALAGLRDVDAGREIEQRLVENATPFQTSRVVFHAGDPNLQPEGIAKHDNKWLFASVHQNKIVWEDGSLFANTSPQSSMGMKVFGSSLWVANTATLEGGATPENVGQSTLSEFDLNTGELIASYSVADTLSHWFGDVEVGPNGDVYVSDSNAPGVYVLRNNKLEALVIGDPFSSPQGLAFAGGKLFVADYSAGIFEVDITNQSASLLKYQPNMILLGIDGLYAHGTSTSGTGLVAVQNGMVPPRVVYLELGEPRTITSLRVLDSNLPQYSDPTLGVVMGDSLFYMANSQWPLFSPNATSADSLQRLPPMILGVPLK